MTALLRKAGLGAAVLFALAGPAHACRIIIPPPWPHPPPEVPPPPRVEPMQTRVHKADIRIEGRLARVEVSATFYNPNNQRIEGVYFFPIEPDAVVRSFSMVVNGKEQEAELLDADKARKTYEDIVRQMRDPALLEYVGTRMLKARIFPIEPKAEVQVRLSYAQVVQADAGLFRLRYPLRSARPDTGGGRVGQVAIKATVRGDAPVKLFYSPSHKIDTVRPGEKEASGGFEQSDVLPDRDFDLYWSEDRAAVGLSVATWKPAGEDGYCLIAIAPPDRREEDRSPPKDLVFAFDKSGSMAGDKIRQAQSALKYCLAQLDRGDRFAVLAFGTDVDDLTGGLVDAGRDAVSKAQERVAALEARGGTAIHEAATRAAALVGDSKRLAMVVFLTDGNPTVGPTDVGEILGAVKKTNAAKARFFVFGVGHDLNTDLVDRLAVENGGTQQYVGEQEDIEEKVSAFYDKIARPVMSDLAVEARGAELYDLYPRRIPDLFAGGQILLFGRYRGGGRHAVVVRGRRGERAETCETEADFDGRPGHDFLPPAWAHRKVAFLLEEIRLHGHSKELEEEVVALGKRHGILTPYTSFLVAEDEPAPLREGREAARRSFEQTSNGRGGVAASRALAEAKVAAETLSPGAPAAMGFDAAWGAGGAAAEGAAAYVERASRQVRRVADKVFVQADDGWFYDTEFDGSRRPEIVEVARWSDAYFELLDRHPGIGRYLAEGLKMVVCAGGKVYRIGD